MNKKGISRFTLRLALVAAVLVCAMIACAGAAYADATSMVPEKNDKGIYEIYNADQLEVYWQYIVQGRNYTASDGSVALADKNASAILMNDIDYEGSTLKPTVEVFYSERDPYKGVFDGNGKKVINIPETFANVNSSYAGSLLSYNKGTIKNVTLDFGTVNVQGRYSSSRGLLCYRNMEGGIISGVTIKADIISNMYNQYILCGLNDGMILNCSTHGSLTCSVQGYNSPIGSPAYMSTGMTMNFYNTADIKNTANGWVYGLAQYANERVINCYNVGKLMRGETEVTDLTQSADTVIVNCYKSTDTFTAADLGDAYMDDLEGDDALNNGYPVLKYQITGEYPHVESIEDLTVKAVKAVSDTSLSFSTDTEFSYYKPQTTDFTVIATNESGISVSVTPSNISWGKKSKTLTYSSLLKQKSVDGFYLSSTKEQEITVKLLASGQELCSSEFTIPASDDWRDYTEEPELISYTDDRYDGKFGGYYKITTAEELAWFASNYKTDASAFLAADIDLGGRKWYGVGSRKGSSYEVAFSGTFDGNGYTISNVTSDNGTGLILSLSPSDNTTSGVVKNVRIENGYITGLNRAGGIINEINKGSVINCSFDGEVRVEGGSENYNDNGAGGIAGASYDSRNGSVIGCVNYGKITGRQPAKTGGIVGHSGGLAIENCYNMGETNGAGILGDTYSSAEATYVANCYNAGKAGYAISAAQYGNVRDCYTLAGAGTVTFDVSVFTEEEATNGTLLDYLGDEFVEDTDNINKGYPVLKWQNPLTAALERYPEEIEYYVNIDEYNMSKDEVQAIIDDAKAKLAEAKSSTEAKSILADAKAAIDAIPSDNQIKQNMEDELEALRQQIENANKTLAFDMCLISLDKTSFTYNGKAFEPAVKATNKDGTALVKDTDFEVIYEANTEPGVGKVKVTGKGENYAGTRELTFKILPKKNKITSLKKAKKAFTVKWTKDNKATGYQVSYGLKKNFKGAKTVKITKNTTVSKKVSKLKAKKKYFVRVRTYVTSGEQTIYGVWSPVKSVKTK
jgi:hypothetical protein